MDLHLQIIQSISTILCYVNSSVCQQSTVTECILNLLDPSTAWGGAIIILIDLVSTNILLAMLEFALSPKRHADFCFKPSGLFLNPNSTISLKCAGHWAWPTDCFLNIKDTMSKCRVYYKCSFCYYYVSVLCDNMAY